MQLILLVRLVSYAIAEPLVIALAVSLTPLAIIAPRMIALPAHLLHVDALTCAAPGRRWRAAVALAMGPEKAVCVGVVGGGAHKEESERPDGKGDDAVGRAHTRE